MKVVMIGGTGLIGTVMAQEPKITSLMSDDHSRACARRVERYPPTQCTCVCLRAEGSVVMQLKGGQQVTLTPGQTFYEGPDDVHVVDRNASGTQPAKFLVLLIKDKGAPALVPAQ